jgi:hypothetical protein
MKGKLIKVDDKWYVEYTGVSYKGGNPKRLGSYTKKFEKKTLPLHPNFVTMTDYVWVKGVKVYDGGKVKFTEVLVNPMGREVDSNDLGQNHSKCVWYARLDLRKNFYCGDEVDYGEQCLSQCDGCVDATGVDYGYLPNKERERGITITHKQEQKQHLIDMMKGDEELGLYDGSKQEDLDCPFNFTSRCTIGRCDCKPKQEILIEDVFNDEKREGAKRVIHQHKVLKSLSLINPLHLRMTDNGHGEFPDGYKLTEKGIQYIIEQLNKE